MTTNANSFNAHDTLRVGDRSYSYYRLDSIERAGLTKLARLPYSLKILLENLLRFEDGRSVTEGRHRSARALGSDQAPRERDRVSSGARAAARFYRRSVRRRSGRDARCDGRDGRRSEEDQSAAAGRAGHRPFGAGRLLRLERRVCQERRSRVRAQSRTLRVPEVGPRGARRFSRRAARYGHRASGQHRVS